MEWHKLGSLLPARQIEFEYDIFLFLFLKRLQIRQDASFYLAVNLNNIIIT